MNYHLTFCVFCTWYSVGFNSSLHWRDLYQSEQSHQEPTKVGETRQILIRDRDRMVVIHTGLSYHFVVPHYSTRRRGYKRSLANKRGYVKRTSESSRTLVCP